MGPGVGFEPTRAFADGLQNHSYRPLREPGMECKHCREHTDNPKFCSQSCAAKHNNPRKRKAVKHCRNCNCELKDRRNTYCSNQCQQVYQRTARIESGTYTPRQAKAVLLEKQAQCSTCKLSVWNDLPIPLELDHINGNAEDNSFENLRLLCPNCHAQTDTYKGRNRGQGRHSRRQRYQDGKSY